MTLRATLPQPKPCKVCKCKFQPHMSMATVCGVPCAQALAVSIRGKAAKIAAIKDKRETKAKIIANKPRSYWLAKAKRAVQKSRRLEELSKGRGCMSCGRSQHQVTNGDAYKPGGFWDGGHFLSKGARPELSLEPKNVWLQCKTCNAGSGKYAKKSHTVNQSFRANLIASEGLELVEWLESPHELKHYSTQQIQAIATTHNARAREIQKGMV